MNTLLSILKERGYIHWWWVSSLVVYDLYSIVPHLRELGGLMQIDSVTGAGGSVVWQGIIALLTHSGKDTLIPTLILSVLTGLSIMLLAKYYTLHGKFLVASGGTGIIGAIIGVMGIGCAACGTLALTTVLGLFGLGFVIRFLPLGGSELYYISIAVMAVSIVQMTRLVAKPLVCPIDFNTKK